jgi:hypothetical protein
MLIEAYTSPDTVTQSHKKPTHVAVKDASRNQLSNVIAKVMLVTGQPLYQLAMAM